MNDCCDSSVAEPGARACETCTERGSPVQLQAVKALLTEVALRRVQLTPYRFCANPACETVYFGDAGDRFGTRDIRVPVWHKEPSGDRLFAACDRALASAAEPACPTIEALDDPTRASRRHEAR